jgi:outer membrane protein assembly factor BamB
MRRRVKRFLLFLLIPLSFSCSLFRTKIAPYPGGIAFPLVEASRVSYEGKIVRDILKGDEDLYLSTDKGLLYCLDGAAQKIKWTYAAAAPFGCPPSVSPDSVYAWDEESNIYCLDNTGAVRWKKTLKEKISSGISRDQDKLYVGTEEGTFWAIRQSTGESLWQLKTGQAFQARAVFWGSQVIAACSDGKLYFINRKADLGQIVEIGSPIRISPLVDGDRLYLGTEDSAFQCFDLRSKKRKWKIKLGGQLVLPPRADEKRIYFVAANSVLYCLDKKGGNILWWWIAPSRSAYDLEFSADKILITSLSSILFCLDRKTGKEIGRYDAKTEIKSNPLWDNPYVVINLHDYIENKGAAVYLRKEVKVQLTSSLSSPQPAGTEISFTAAATGFYLPKYEFYLRSGEEKTVVQKESEKNSWTWFPDKEGNYTAGVKVSDEKQAMEAEVSFEILKKTK